MTEHPHSPAPLPDTIKEAAAAAGYADVENLASA